MRRDNTGCTALSLIQLPTEPLLFTGRGEVPDGLVLGRLVTDPKISGVVALPGSEFCLLVGVTRCDVRLGGDRCFFLKLWYF